MNNNEIRVIVFNPEIGIKTETTIVKGSDGTYLDSIYAALDIRMIECVTITPTLKAYVDEEALLKGPQKLSVAFVSNGEIVNGFFGNLMFINNDDEGNTIGLTDDQVKEIEDLPTGEVISYEEEEPSTALIISLDKTLGVKDNEN